MRKVILQLTVSLDGFFEGPNRELDWHQVDDEQHQHFNDELRKMSVFIEGRVTYELMESYWPTADQDPDTSPTMVEFAGIWRDTPKLVYSTTLESVGPNATLLREVDAAYIEELKRQPGGDMVVGGADLGATFLRLDLIDEFRLYIAPVVLGAGRPWLAHVDAPVKLNLAATQTFGNGVVQLKYTR